MRRIALPFTVAVLCVAVAYAQNGYTGTNAIPDKPISADAERLQRMMKAIEPYVQKARETYPAAKTRYLAGLPEHHTFFITARIVDATGKVEQVFIRVESIHDGWIAGKIASRIDLISGYAEGDDYKLSEKDLVDWTIVRPDGSEEGNVVGTFLDTYQDEAPK